MAITKLGDSATYRDNRETQQLTKLNEVIDAVNAILAGVLTLGGVTITAGSGSPEAAVTAAVGSLYLRTNGSDDAVLYVKVTGAGNTGWVASANP